MAIRVSSHFPRIPRSPVAGSDHSSSKDRLSSRDSVTGTTYVFNLMYHAISWKLTITQYIIDGYHVSHDPAKDHTTEPTTGRKLNIIDIPAAKSTSKTTSSSSDRKSRRVSTASIPKGRGLSPERIVAPKPQRPHETRQVINTQYDKTTLEDLNRRFAKQQIAESSDESDYDSDEGSDVPSLTSRSTNSSSPSSVSSGSSCCTCEVSCDCTECT